MKLAKLFSILYVLQLIISCSPSYEVAKPYRNWGYSNERLLPIKTNNSKFSLRIWINNSTSIDRVISISKDTFEDYKGYMVEYGNLYNKSKKKHFYNESAITPKDGFVNFMKKVENLNLFNYTNKQPIGVVEHQPISLYVVEIKRDSLYNIFKFESNYPIQTEEKDKYQVIEKLLFDEFNLFEKFRFQKNDS